jgi:PAS domain-containing protein
MQRFILKQNIERFRRLLREKTDDMSQRTLRSLLLATQRDLAFLEAAAVGVGVKPRASDRAPFRPAAHIAQQFQAAFGNSPMLCLAIDPGPGLHIIAMNDAYAEAALLPRADMLGKPLFDIFPDNPDDPFAAGVNTLYTSLRMASETGKPHAIATYRYDVRGPDGQFVERWWSPLNSPIFDEDGHLLYLLHQVEDVTSRMLSSAPP